MIAPAEYCGLAGIMTLTLVLKRTAILLLIVLSWALLTAAGRAATRVPFDGYSAGTIVVKTQERRLYYVLDGRHALRFVVGVGKAGWRWHGNATIEGKYIKPAWRAPPAITRAGWGAVIPGGSSRNPMGAAALTMLGGEYAIHGTNNPGSIGGFVSHGCIRMYNHDIRELYSMVGIGTPVIVE
jgi:lipoprotein-anchoring transpeptidase ErfK/SrfK